MSISRYIKRILIAVFHAVYKWELKVQILDPKFQNEKL